MTVSFELGDREAESASHRRPSQIIACLSTGRNEAKFGPNRKSLE